MWVVVALWTIALLLIFFTRKSNYVTVEPKLIDNVITQDDCNYIINLAKFSPSTTLDGNTDHRTSETAWLPKTDPVARKVLLKACDLTGYTLDHCEELQVVRYKPGTFYKPHQDSCCDNNGTCRDFTKTLGERVCTLLVYLNNDFTDGETEFPNIGKKFKPPPGSGVYWNPKGCDEKVLHAGLPIGQGTKYVCNAWIREKKY